MNTKNNKRRRESVDKIQRAFMHLLQEKEVRDITVSELCQVTGLNRSTFYANFMDVYELADRVKEKLESDFTDLFAHYDYYHEHTGALKMFTHIRDNQLFYKTYFKLCYDNAHQVTIYDQRRAELEFHNKNIRYHIEFFRNGFNAIVKMWLAGGCEETPEEMAEILRQEYRGRENLVQ